MFRLALKNNTLMVLDISLIYPAAPKPATSLDRQRMLSQMLRRARSLLKLMYKLLAKMLPVN